MTGVNYINILLDAFGKAHPAVSHFPIALLTVALLAESISLWRSNLRFHSISKYCLYFGTAGAIFSTLSGFPFETIMFLSYRPHLLYHHRHWAYIVVAVSVLACLFHLFRGRAIVTDRKFRTIYVSLLIILTALIIITGHTGGMLVYGENFFNLIPPPSSVPSV